MAFLGMTMGGLAGALGNIAEQPGDREKGMPIDPMARARDRDRRWEDLLAGFFGGPEVARLLAARRRRRMADTGRFAIDEPAFDTIGNDALGRLIGGAPDGAAQMEEIQTKPSPADAPKMLAAQSEVLPRYSWGPPSRPRRKPTAEEIARWRARPMVPTYVPPRPGKQGYSQHDPIYDQIEAPLEQELGLPTGILAALRTRGERSPSDAISEEGARTVYQITPPTRRGFFRQSGVDGYADAKQAARMAALHLIASYKHPGTGGSWNRALTEYHGGPKKERWGRRTRAYQPRTGDFDR